MSENSLCRTVILLNSAGMHARPADLFVKMAMQYQSQINVVRDSQRVDGKSILDLLMLGAPEGSELTIEATGDDAQAAIDALAELVAQKFFED